MTVHNTEFSFYLEAYHYAKLHGIRFDLIKRKDWKTWVIDLKDQIKTPWKFELEIENKR